MTTDPTVGSEDAYVARLKTARESSAVLKLRLAALRAKLPNVCIFVFEGDDDKIVYCQWINRANPEVRYEPFTCKGKTKLKQAKVMLSSDLTGLSRGIYFFVDRDFDDLNGFPDAEGVFMTDTYSVENLLVSRIVLDSLLRNEFPFDGEPDRREEIGSLFEKVYNEFLATTSDINFRIYVARMLGVEIDGGLPVKLNRVARVSLDHVEPGDPADQLVRFSKVVDPEEVGRLRAAFQQLAPAERFRGKFALMFFGRWLDLLVAECTEPVAGGLLRDWEAPGKPRSHELTLANFASKSIIPGGLDRFLSDAA